MQNPSALKFGAWSFFEVCSFPPFPPLYPIIVHKRVVTLVAALFLLMLALLTLEAWREASAPLVEGKPLSFWLKSLDKQFSYIYSEEPRFDTNAVLVLTKALDKQDGPILRVYQVAWPNLPSPLQAHLPQPPSSKNIRLRAVAISTWAVKDHPSLASKVIHALRYDPEPQVRKAAVDCLSINCRNDEASACALALATRDRDPSVRRQAVYDLGYFYRYPAIVVPALTPCLQDTDANVRKWAADSLRKSGTFAHAAVPSLLQALNDTNSDVRVQVRQALKQIDPEAATKAGIK
jgi:hypothetical protein